MEPYAKAHQHRQHSFLLSTEPVYRLRNPEGYFGYADTTAILCTGHSLTETADRASSHIGELVKMGCLKRNSLRPRDGSEALLATPLQNNSAGIPRRY
jgi:hypothetical protein